MSEEAAWRALGNLQHSGGKNEDATECYTHAYELALTRHDVPQTDQARALVGVSKGDQDLDRKMRMAGMALSREVAGELVRDPF